MKETIDGQLVMIKRTDIVQVKDFYQKPLENLLVATCCNKWGVEIPQNLKSSLDVILINLTEVGASSELVEKIKSEIRSRAVCSRAVGNNRHGHNNGLIYPGAAHWTQPYDEKRKGNFSDKKQYLIEMKRFTHTVQKWQEECNDNQELLSTLNQLSEDYLDARCLNVVKLKTEKRLKKKGIVVTLTEVLPSERKEPHKSVKARDVRRVPEERHIREEKDDDLEDDIAMAMPDETARDVDETEWEPAMITISRGRGRGRGRGR